MPDVPAQAQNSAGGCNGSWGIAAALREGAAAVPGAGAAARREVIGDDEADCGGVLGALPHGRDPAHVKAFVDFQNDVTAKDIGLAVREGFRSIEHVKRYTTSGMATDQGKTSNMNALAIAAAAQGKAVPDVGLTTSASPIRPSPSVPSRAFPAESFSILFGKRPSTAGPRNMGRVSKMSASGSVPIISRSRARTCTPPWRANAGSPAKWAACSMVRPWARSKWSGLMPPSS